MTSPALSRGGVLAVALAAAACGTQTYTQAIATPVPEVIAPPIAQITVLGINGLPRWPIGPEVETETARLLADSLRARNAALTVRAPELDRALLDEAGLDSAWIALADIWLETGVVDGRLLRDMADAVGADAILGGALLREEEAPGTSGVGTRRASRRMVVVRLWLFDARSGELVWEAAAESTTRVDEGFLAALIDEVFDTETEEIAPAPLAEAVVRAIRDLTRTLPRLPQNLPDPPDGVPSRREA